MFRITRREFVGQAAASLAATAVSFTAGRAAPAAEPLAIIDTHQHLWDLKKFRLPWIDKASPLARSFVLRDYDAATAGLNVVQSVYMEVDVDPAQQVAEVDHVRDLCRRADNVMTAAVVSGRPASDGFAKYLDHFKGSAYIKGVRQVLHGAGTPAGYCLHKNFVRGIRLLGERGLRFDLCMRAPELPAAAKLIDACPDTRFILDHCGNPNVQAKDHSRWKKDLEAVAKRKSVVCKVSGIVASARPGKWTADDLAPIVNHTLDTFGPDRVMFGGDWPVCTLAATFKQWVEALKSIVRARPMQQQRNLFHDNAVRFYGLEREE
jgi:predicted TIM-barrel fold metal-dependent hydrolase